MNGAKERTAGPAQTERPGTETRIDVAQLNVDITLAAVDLLRSGAIRGGSNRRLGSTSKTIGLNQSVDDGRSSSANFQLTYNVGAVIDIADSQTTSPTSKGESVSEPYHPGVKIEIVEQQDPTPENGLETPQKKYRSMEWIGGELIILNTASLDQSGNPSDGMRYMYDIDEDGRVKSNFNYTNLPQFPEWQRNNGEPIAAAERRISALPEAKEYFNSGRDVPGEVHDKIWRHVGLIGDERRAAWARVPVFANEHEDEVQEGKREAMRVFDEIFPKFQKALRIIRVRARETRNTIDRARASLEEPLMNPDF